MKRYIRSSIEQSNNINDAYIVSDEIYKAISGDQSAIQSLKKQGYKVRKLVNPLQPAEVGTFEIVDPTTGKTYNYDNSVSYYSKTRVTSSTRFKRTSRYNEFDNGIVSSTNVPEAQNSDDALWDVIDDEEFEFRGVQDVGYDNDGNIMVIFNHAISEDMVDLLAEELLTAFRQYGYPVHDWNTNGSNVFILSRGDVLGSTEVLNSRYSPDLLNDLVNYYRSFDTMPSEEIWDEIVAKYNNEDLANDVLESLDDYEEDLDYER